jgi:hypothetical protein
MNESKVQYIDVSNMTEKEICSLVQIRYILAISIDLLFT